MEPIEGQVRYVFPTTVNRVEESFRMEHTGGIGKEAGFERVSLGWFLFLEGSHEGLFLGNEKPDFAPGDRVKVTIEKVHNAKP